MNKKAHPVCAFFIFFDKTYKIVSNFLKRVEISIKYQYNIVVLHIKERENE